MIECNSINISVKTGGVANVYADNSLDVQLPCCTVVRNALLINSRPAGKPSKGLPGLIHSDDIVILLCSDR